MGLSEKRKQEIANMSREEIIHLSNNKKCNEDADALIYYFSDEEIIKKRCSVDKKTITFSTPSKTGTSYFRAEEPMLAIYRATDEFNLIYTESIKPFHYNISDLLVLHRCGEGHALTFKVLENWMRDKKRPLTINNSDDNETHISAIHPMAQLWRAQGKDKMAIEGLIKADCVETTTHKMKQTFFQMNKNVMIVRNKYNYNAPQWNLEKYKDFDYKYFNKQKDSAYTDFEFFKNYDKNKDIIIGWSGLTSHYEDITKMYPIMKEVYNKRPNTKFIIAGMALKDNSYVITNGPDGKPKITESPITDKSQTYAYRVRNLFKDFDPSRILFFDALDLENYAWFNSLFDIALAYVVHNSFNNHKSEIKAIEAMHYRNFPIMSNYGGYTDLLQMLSKEKIDVNKISCNTEFKSEWVEKLLYAVDHYRDADTQRMLDALKQFTLDHYDINRDIDERIAFYNKIIEENNEKESQRMIDDVYAFQYTA